MGRGPIRDLYYKTHWVGKADNYLVQAVDFLSRVDNLAAAGTARVHNVR